MRRDAIAFTVPGKPSAKARARSGRYGHYTPESTQRAEAAVLECFLYATQGGIRPHEGPVRLEVTATFRIPRSWSKKKAAAHEGAPHLSKPDTDNITKLVKDALEGYAYVNDSQVYRETAEKRWSNGSEGIDVMLVFEERTQDV